MSHGGSVTLGALRIANTLRLPQFRNNLGAPAHTEPDGSDWTVAQWVQAWVGEVGEFCRVREEYERGALTDAQYATQCRKELPDSLIYQDILALRCLDKTEGQGTEEAIDAPDAAQVLMSVVACLGTYANARKKFDRGDITKEDLQLVANIELSVVTNLLWGMADVARFPPNKKTSERGEGIDLSRAVIDKFNETSTKVGSSVFFDSDDGSQVFDRQG